MRIVWPFKSLSVARACARVDSGLDKAKICSDRRVDADRPQLRAVFGGGKTFLHGLDPNRKSLLRETRTASGLPRYQVRSHHEPKLSYVTRDGSLPRSFLLRDNSFQPCDVF